MEGVALVGIDLGKSVFHLHGQDASGAQVFRKKIVRARLIDFCASLPSCTIAMEACGGAHFMARELMAIGHQVKLISPQFVRPFVKNNKNDFVDAEAICEAASRPSMRFVSPKDESQQLLSALHCVRQSLMQERIRAGNQIHAFLLEFGICLPRACNVSKQLQSALATQPLPAGTMQLVDRLHNHFLYLQTQIASVEKQLLVQLASSDIARKLLTIPGVGPITASALVSEIGDGSQFACSRDFAAWLGLVPRQRSTGGKTKLLGIRRGAAKPIRSLLILCARSYMVSVGNKKGSLAEWVRSLMVRRPSNVVACALANKLARIAWAIVTHKMQFEARPPMCQNIKAERPDVLEARPTNK